MYNLLIIRIRLLFCLPVIAVFLLLANPADALGSDNEPGGKHLLWSVETGRNTVYLLGSIHILKKDSYPLPEALEDIFTCCKKVIFETDLDGMDSPDIQSLIAARGRYPSGRTLSSDISRETYSLLRKKLEMSGLSIAQFEQFRPWFVAMTITAMELQRLGFDPDLGIDRYFYQKAKNSKKKMIFLETNKFQLNLMASLSGRQQDLFLKGVLRELDIVESLASDMLDAWKTGDAVKLDSILKESHADSPVIYDRLFIRRNRSWFYKIKRMLKGDEDILVIVGAGHLVGKDSLIDLFKKQGYRVEQKKTVEKRVVRDQ